MTKFIIYDSDGNKLFNADNKRFIARIFEIVDHYKVALFTSEGKYFNGGIYDSKDKAKAEIERLYSVKDSGKADKFYFRNDRINAYEIFESLFTSLKSVSALYIIDQAEQFHAEYFKQETPADEEFKIKNSKLKAVSNIDEQIQG